MTRTNLMAAVLALLAGTTLAACGDDHDHGVETVFLDDASDEVLVTLQDTRDAGDITVDASRAPSLDSPASETTLSRAAAPELNWTVPAQSPSRPRHGVDTGQFAWIILEGEGGDIVDILALDSTSYTPTTEEWEHLAGGDTLSVTTVTAYVEDGVVTEGPYTGTAPVEFTVGE